MKKLIAILILISMVFLAQAQNSKFSYGLNVSYERSFQTFYRGNEQFVPSFSDRLTLSRKMVYSYGLDVSYEASPLFSVNTSVLFSKKGSSFSNTRFNDGGGFSFVDTNPFDLDQSIDIEYSFVELPIVASIMPGEGYFKIIGSLGIAPAYLTRKSFVFIGQDLDGNKVKTVSSESIAKDRFIISSIVSLGLAFNYDENVQFRVEPTLKVTRNRLDEEFHHSYFKTVGINVSCYLKLAKLKDQLP